MSKVMLAAALVLATRAIASAEPPRCHASGTPIFEIHDTVKTGPNPMSLTRLYTDGAYTSETTDATGAPTAHVGTKCLARPQLDEARAALADATWTVTTARIKCMVASLKLRTYTVDGKPVFVETVCSGRTLDARSAAAIATLTGMLLPPS